MVDTLTACLDASSGLTFDCLRIKCPLLDEFRSAVFRLLTLHEGESENTFKRAFRKKLWRLVIDLSDTPIPWNASLESVLELEEGSFKQHVSREFGREFNEVAEFIEQLWSVRMPQSFDNPMYTSLRDRVQELRDQNVHFRILAINRQRANYAALLDDVELTGADVFCTAAQIKRLDPFDTLVTCGPFRDEVDAVFSSPRYPNIINVRWTHDNDVYGFPNYLSTDINLADSDAQFPSDFPVQIKVVDQFDVFESQAAEATGDSTLTAWSFDDFEALFVRRKHDRRTSKLPPNPVVAESESESHEFAAVKLSFVDGSEWQLEFDQLGKPPLVLSIDGDGDRELKRRRLSLDRESRSENDLLPGMLVVVEPDATESLRELAESQQKTSRHHLQGWKRQLREKVQNLAPGIGVKFALQGVGFRDSSGEQKVERWSSLSNGIEAPRSKREFEIVVGKFAGYPHIEEAWEEIVSLRGDAIQGGLNRERNINRYLENAVRDNLDLIADESRSVLKVEGFAEPIAVVEYSHATFYRNGQLSQIGKYRRSDDAEDLDWLNG